MPKNKIKLIINPNADLGRAWRLGEDLNRVVAEFGGADWSGTVYPTHATQLAMQAADEGYETVVSIGGDGTTHEIINGLMMIPAERRPRLGVVPVGTGNDFAHSVGVPIRPEIAMRQVFSGTPKKVDLAVVVDEHGRQEYWDNTFGIGFDATVTLRSRRVPVLRGFFVYLVSVIQTIVLNYDAAHLKVQTDNESWEDDILMLVMCNGPREGGGFHVAPEAVNNDGHLDYAGITKVSRLMMFRLIPEVMKGTHGRFKQVRMNRFRQMKVESDRPLFIHIDGEIYAGFGSNVRQLSIEILPGALEVMV
jgi:YegS/Rv2252/BmrU family lipid kinase